MGPLRREAGELERQGQVRGGLAVAQHVRDIVYGEALAFVRSVFRLGGRSEKVIWGLLSTVQRRRLKGKARRESEARAEGRRGPKGKAPESPEE